MERSYIITLIETYTNKVQSLKASYVLNDSEAYIGHIDGEISAYSRVIEDLKQILN